jgi:hypothetical protein
MMSLPFDELAAFMHRERNSLHYHATNNGATPFNRGYSTAIDGIIARMAREFRGVDGFDESRFLAMAEGRFSPDDVFDANGKRLGSRSEVYGES